MTIETLLLPLLSGVIGWALRHYGIVDPTAQAPQSRPAGAGTSPAQPAQADVSAWIRQLVQAEMEKAVAALEKRLLPTAPVPSAPQPSL